MKLLSLSSNIQSFGPVSCDSCLLQASTKSELSVKDALRKATSNGHVDQAISGQATNSRIGESGRGTWTDSAGGLIPWLIRVQSSRKQA